MSNFNRISFLKFNVIAFFDNHLGSLSTNSFIQIRRWNQPVEMFRFVGDSAKNIIAKILKLLIWQSSRLYPKSESLVEPEYRCDVCNLYQNFLKLWFIQCFRSLKTVSVYRHLSPKLQKCSFVDFRVISFFYCVYYTLEILYHIAVSKQNLLLR